MSKTKSWYELMEEQLAATKQRNHPALPLGKDTEGWEEFFSNEDFANYDAVWNDFGDSGPMAKRCTHKWKKTELIFSHVWDCEKCGKKKEDCD